MENFRCIVDIEVPAESIEELPDHISEAIVFTSAENDIPIVVNDIIIEKC